MGHEMNGEEAGLGQSGWDDTRSQYVCKDGVQVKVPFRTADIIDLDEESTLPSSGVRHARDAQGKLRPRITISGVEFDRGMRTLFGGSEGVRTIIFPSMLRTVRQGAFYKIKSLLKAVMNEGLEVLGTDEFKPDGDWYSGVFQKSGLRDVVFPSTLKRIEDCAFDDCEDLKTVRFPERLEYLGRFCFSNTGLKSVDFPASLRMVSQGSFSWCKSLKSVRFAEGLEVLGTDERQSDDTTWVGAFQKSVLESIRLPSTLKRMGHRTFMGCGNLKAIELPDRLEYLGKECF